ncbi:hypothetical protein HF313_17650 [Massilia atriviolacea]|uniref:Uncharacterized protein n=1 Tax=Massilia atriviolacea TaxID=2495579 RepID=A0A430HTM9_9BURK|nr:hypothetical protein [Massilia atriviolacea]RSZ60887.1 hypothetical protein EJB06_01750 [Massilia atriviolacea]
MPAVFVAFAWPAGAIAATTRKAPETDVGTQLRALAQQRPWACPDQGGAQAPGPGLSGGQAECAWQNRLRMRRWSGAGAAVPGACVSAQAHWWAWARAGTGAPVWRSGWTSQSIVDEQGPLKRIVALRRLDDGGWNVTEWRWDPSARAATRRWQEQRWALLKARAAQWQSAPEPASGAAEARMLQRVLEAHLGGRVAEAAGQAWQWPAQNLCIGVDALGLGQQLMQLPYAADDSRREQRAAMQLQLARRYPKATWLTPFSLVPAAPHARGGAKFHAVWIENTTLKGQLWIPTRGDGPLVRLRLVTALAPGAAAQDEARARAEQLMLRELRALAARWVAEHE